RLMERGTIEVAPLAYMRGRTLNDSFIILDEAQNTTPEQMKMFLTRLGFGSKAVVTGDVTQIDLPDAQHRSGLLLVREVPVDVARWVRLAQLVLDEERVTERLGADTEMSLLFVDAPTIAELNERFLGASGPTDVLAFPIDDELPPSGRQPDQGGRGPGT